MKQSELLTATHGKSTASILARTNISCQAIRLAGSGVATPLPTCSRHLKDQGSFFAWDLRVSLIKNLYNSGSLINSS